MDRGARRKGVDLTASLFVVGVDLLDPFPANDRLGPSRALFVDLGGELEEVTVVGLREDRVDQPLGDVLGVYGQGGLGGFPSGVDIPRAERERFLANGEGGFVVPF